MELGRRETGQVGAERNTGSLRDKRLVGDLLRVHHHPAEQETHQAHGDLVHHDRRKDLVDVAVGLQRTGHGSPQPPGQRAGDDAGGDERPRRPIGQRQGQGGGGQAAEDELAFAADVGHAGAEGHADAGAHKKQGRGLDHRAGDRVHAAERALDQRGVSGDRVGAQRQQHHRADQKSCQGRDKRHQGGQPAQPHVRAQAWRPVDGPGPTRRRRRPGRQGAAIHTWFTQCSVFSHAFHSSLFTGCPTGGPTNRKDITTQAPRQTAKSVLVTPVTYGQDAFTGSRGGSGTRSGPPCPRRW